MIYNFDQLPARRSTESIKWNYFDEDVLPMWVADMDFQSPEPVIRALQERVAHGVFGYASETPALRQSVVNWLADRHGWQVAPEDLVFVPGVVTGLNMAAHAFTEPGDGIMIQPPVYMPFLTVPRNAGAVRQDAALYQNESGEYRIDFEAFENAITDETRVFILCNPHNPVGRVFTREELGRLAEICLSRDILILSDEIHSDLVFSGHKHVPMASLSAEIAQKTITLLAPSKTFNIAGLSCSVAIIQNPDLRKRFSKAHGGMVHGVNLLGLVAAQAAYCEGKEWLAQLLVYLEGNRDYLYSFVQNELPGVKMVKPEGTYMAWLDFRALGLGDCPSDFFLEKARVAQVDGGSFGKGGEGFVRLNFGCPRPMLAEALERMKKALVNR